MTDGSSEGTGAWATEDLGPAWSLTPDLRGQVALVTGGGRGIGRAIGRALAECGERVVLAARTEVEVAGAAAEIGAAGGEAVAVRTDLASADDIGALFARVRDQFGPLDILINNAGIVKIAPFADTALDDFDAQVAVNLRGVFLSCQEALKVMIPRRRGYIINIASACATRGCLYHAAYGAAKHGVMGLTKVLAMEAQAHHIRVSAILPGGVETYMLSKGQPDLMKDPSILLRPVDVAGTVLFLLALPERAAIDQIHLRRYAGAPFPA
jgi:NAD(P)-dependent dehydrogenase (short-subunit alcohol dehydrogenase family)